MAKGLRGWQFLAVEETNASPPGLAAVQVARLVSLLGDIERDLSQYLADVGALPPGKRPPPQHKTATIDAAAELLDQMGLAADARRLHELSGASNTRWVHAGDMFIGHPEIEADKPAALHRLVCKLEKTFLGESAILDSHLESKASTPSKIGLRIDAAACRVEVVRGPTRTSYELSANQVTFLMELYKARGNWVTKSGLGLRSRDIKPFPKPLQELIEKKGNAGFRLNPDLIAF